MERGGLKLEKAMKVFPVELAGKVCMDIGASTGGFTDCYERRIKGICDRCRLRTAGHASQTDERVVCMENVNFRYLKPSDIVDIPILHSLMFLLSLSKILPAAYDIISEKAEMVCLIKPCLMWKRNVVKKE